MAPTIAPIVSSPAFSRPTANISLETDWICPIDSPAAINHAADHAHQPALAAIGIVRELLGAGQGGHQLADLGRGTLLLQEGEDDADRLAGGGVVEAGCGHDARDEFFHRLSLPLALSRGRGG